MRYGIGALALALGSPALLAAPQDEVSVAGELRSADSGQVLSGVTVEINGATALSDASGRYALTLPRAEHYRVRFAGPRHYESRHFFAESELAGRDSALSIPRVELVERRAGRQLLVFGGDVMAGRRYEQPLWGEKVLLRPEQRAEDSRALLAEVAPDLRAADLASVNLEIVLADQPPGEASDKSITFYAHPELANALKWAGVDYVSLGNNHAYDYFEAGIRTTRAAVEKAGLAWSGAGLDQAEALAPWRGTVGGAPYSFLGFVGWKGTAEPHQAAEGAKGGAALGTEESITAAVGREEAAKRVTVVQYHGSSEYSLEPSDNTRRKMLAAIESGADLAIGHHPHVLQGFSIHQGKLVAWSLGNLLFDQYFYETHGSALLKVWMDGERFHRAEIVPLHVRDYRPVPAIGAMRRAVLRRLAAQSAPNGVAIRLSGGHGVIEPGGGAAAPGEQSIALDGAGTVAALPAGLDHPLAEPRAATDAEGRPLRFGSDLLWRGDFEAFDALGARDRSWHADGARLDADADAFASRWALKVAPDGSGAPMRLEQKVFHLSFDRTALTLAGRVKAEGPIELAAEAQYRPKRMNRMKALAGSHWLALGSVVVEGGGWRTFEFEVPPPAADQSEFRIRLVMRARDGTVRPVRFDELAIVNWEGEGARASLRPRTHVRLAPGSERSAAIRLRYGDALAAGGGGER